MNLCRQLRHDGRASFAVLDCLNDRGVVNSSQHLAASKIWRNLLKTSSDTRTASSSYSLLNLLVVSFDGVLCCVMAAHIASQGLANGTTELTQPKTPTAYCSNLRGNSPLCFPISSKVSSSFLRLESSKQTVTSQFGLPCSCSSKPIH